MSKTTGQYWRVNGENNLNALNEWIRLQWLQGKKPVLAVHDPTRTVDQNALIWALYGHINRATGNSVVDVKRTCKLVYGVAIRKAGSEEFAAWYDKAIKRLPMEQKLLLMDHIPITSEMSVKQATEYINVILSEYAKQGYNLQDPRKS